MTRHDTIDIPNYQPYAQKLLKKEPTRNLSENTFTALSRHLNADDIFTCSSLLRESERK